MKELPAPSPSGMPAPTEDQIRERAYYLWLEHGCPPGRDREIWFAAQVLLHDRASHQPPSPGDKEAAHSHDPEHRYHNPPILRDARPAVARSGTPQRIRGHRPGAKANRTPPPP